ncbi:MAG: hypothetical protein JW990_20710, partial [Thermoleophilia bacterium]|nr:hypothetical protein [Thermoleophilia bacterium]
MSDLHLPERWVPWRRSRTPWRRFRLLAFVVFAAILIAASNVDGAVASAGSGPVGNTTVTEGAARIALKLAPGARLAETPDGELTVIRDWASLGERSAGAGLPLETAGRIEGLGVTILRPD